MLRRFKRLFLFLIPVLFFGCAEEESCRLATANGTIYETYYTNNQITRELTRCGYFKGTFFVIDEAFRELSVSNWEGSTKNGFDFIFAGPLEQGVYFAKNREHYWSSVEAFSEVTYDTELFGKQTYVRQLEDVELKITWVTTEWVSAIITGKVTISEDSYVQFEMVLNSVEFAIIPPHAGN